ncbi:MAG: DUF47 family protein [Magnetococcus sp. DMHC-8]
MSSTATSPAKSPAGLLDEPPLSLWQKFLNNVFPKVPDFYGLLNDQCEIMVQTMDALLLHMEHGDQGDLIRQLEKRGDEVKARNMAILGKAFATPLDREDIYRAITGIDMIPNYAKTTVREMEVLQLAPDRHMLEMVRVMKTGTDALYRGFSKLAFDPLGAVEDERAVRQSVQDVENCFREAKGGMFEEFAGGVASEGQDDSIEARLMVRTIEMFKHRELYRHLFNLGGQCGHISVAGQVLYDIMVQV